MSLLAMLLALIAERLSSPYRHAEVARGHIAQVLRERLPQVWARTSLMLLFLLLPALLVELLRESIAFVPLRLLYDAALLFACLGPRDLSDDIRLLRKARTRGDSAEVARLGAQLQTGPTPDADHRSLIGALFIQSHERVFGMFWWFLVAGPAGAVLYRCASRLPALLGDPAQTHAEFGAPLGAQFAQKVHAVLAWLPARLTAALFGLAGSFDDAARAWRRVQQAPHDNWQRQTWNLLAEVSDAALDWEDESGGGPVETAALDTVLQEVQRMQARALLILLAITALFGAGTWIA